MPTPFSPCLHCPTCACSIFAMSALSHLCLLYFRHVCIVPLVPALFSPCLYFSDFASDSVTVIGLLGTSSGTQWVILLYWVPPDRVLLRFCVTESDAELSSRPVKSHPIRREHPAQSQLMVPQNHRKQISSSKKMVWPYGRRLNIVLSTEIRVWPNGSALNVFPYGEKGVWPNGSALNVVPYGEKLVWPYGRKFFPI